MVTADALPRRDASAPTRYSFPMVKGDDVPPGQKMLRALAPEMVPPHSDCVAVVDPAGQ